MSPYPTPDRYHCPLALVLACAGCCITDQKLATYHTMIYWHNLSKKLTQPEMICPDYVIFLKAFVVELRVYAKAYPTERAVALIRHVEITIGLIVENNCWRPVIVVGTGVDMVIEACFGGLVESFIREGGKVHPSPRRDSVPLSSSCRIHCVTFPKRLAKSHSPPNGNETILSQSLAIPARRSIFPEIKSFLPLRRTIYIK